MIAPGVRRQPPRRGSIAVAGVRDCERESLRQGILGTRGRDGRQAKGGDVSMKLTPARGAVGDAGCGAVRAAPAIVAIARFGSRFGSRLGLLLGALLVALLAARPAAAERSNEDSVRVTAEQMRQLTVTEVELHAFRAETAAVGQIAFNEDATTDVLTAFSGRVIRLIAGIGQRVTRGAPLLEIDSPEVVQPQSDLIAAVAAMNKARSQLNLAQIAETRDRSLYEGKAGALKEWQQSHAQLVAAQNDLWAAETAVAAARDRLRILGLSEAEVSALQERGEVRRAIAIPSPIDGVVIARKVRPGQYVRSDPGEALYSVADVSTMWLKAFVPETEIPNIRIGQELEVKVAAVPDHLFKAHITYVGATFETSTRRMMVRSEVANAGGALKAEMFASFRIAVGERAPAPAVPIEAVIREGNLAVVFVQAAPMEFQRRKVRLGVERDGRVEIREGLKPGEHVVARGAIFLDNQWRQ